MKVSLPKLPVTLLANIAQGELFVPLVPQLDGCLCARATLAVNQDVPLPLQDALRRDHVDVVVIGDTLDAIPHGLIERLPMSTLVVRVDAEALHVGAARQ